jgi:hypothetical protein
VHAQEKFLSETDLNSLSKSGSSRAARLAAMLTTPIFAPERNERFYRKLSQAPHKRLIEILREAKKIAPESRLPECTFQPGVALTFYSENTPERRLTVLLCFNCDVWALASGPSNLQGRADSGEISSFGDSRPLREELLTLTDTLFPSHSERAVTPAPDND